MSTELPTHEIFVKTDVCMPFKKAMPWSKWVLSLIVLITIAAFGLWLNSQSRPVPFEEKADRVVVLKSQREMRFFRKNQCIFRCTIALGDNPLGHKQKGLTRWIGGITRASATNPSIFPTRIRRISKGRKPWECHREATL
jgi:hypothetical protein